MSTLENWITEVNARLGIEELGAVADPEFVTPLVLDLTRDVAHGVARPAAPITAYLLGLAVARAAGGGAAQAEVATAHAHDLAALALAREGTAQPGSADAGTAADPAGGPT